MTGQQKAAGRGGGQAASKPSCKRLNNTDTCRSALDRLPSSLRVKYLRDCLAADIAYQNLAKALRLLQGKQT
jgi:hypothetical protein